MTMESISGSQGHLSEPVPETVPIGGVTVTRDQIAEAIEILREDKSTQVKLPLMHKDNPLWQADYHGIADDYYSNSNHPKLAEGTPKEHVAHVKSAFMSYLEQQVENLDQSPAGDATAIAPGQLDWTREEVILAMDLYVTVGALNGGPIPSQNSATIIQLSDLLKKLSAYPPERQGEKYRNPNGVYLKLMDLRAIQAEGARGMNAYSQLDAPVWREYIDDLPQLHAEAAAIRAQVQEGVLQPAKTMPVTEDADIEQQHTETFIVNPSSEPRPAERAEQKLVLRYRDYMAAKGIVVRRKKYLPAGEVRPMYSDAWVEDRQVLIEAKNSDSRDALRQAIGQLYDYRRFHQPSVQLAVLLSYQPNAERLDLLRSANIEAVWPRGSGFRDSARGAFT